MDTRDSQHRTLFKRFRVVRKRGVFIPVLALGLGALIAIIALAVDLALMHNARLTWNQIAHSACLGSLETFTATQGDSNAKRLAAFERAKAIVGGSVSLSSSVRSEALQNDLTYAEVGNDNPEPGANGLMVFGRWKSNPSASDDCPANPSMSGSYHACFEPLSGANDVITSIRLDLSIGPSTGLRTFFASIFGKSAFTLETRTVCSIAPRHIVVLFDLSGSSAYETHKRLAHVAPTGEATLEDLRQTRMGRTIWSLRNYYDQDSEVDFYCTDWQWGTDGLSERQTFSAVPYYNNPNPGTTVEWKEHMNLCLPDCDIVGDPDGSNCRTGADRRSELPAFNPSWNWFTNQYPDGTDHTPFPSICPENGQCPIICPDGAGSPGCIHPEIKSCASYWDQEGEFIYGFLNNFRPACAQVSCDTTHRHYKSDYTCWSISIMGFPNENLTNNCYEKCLELYPLSSIAVPSNNQDYNELLLDWRRCLSSGVQECAYMNWGQGQPGACQYEGCIQNTHQRLADAHVNMNSDGLGGYIKPGPKPFTDYLQGLSRLLEIFELRAVAEDRIAVLGYDKDPFKPLQLFYLSAPGTMMFDMMKLLSDFDSLASNAVSKKWVEDKDGNGSLVGLNFSPMFTMWMRHIFFPGASFNGSETNTDLALRRALSLLQDYPNAPSERISSVIVMSDGLANCRNGMQGEYGLTSGGNIVCNDTFEMYTDTFADIETTVQDYFIPSGISLHSVVAGDYVEPYHLLVCDGNGGFINPKKALEYNSPQEQFDFVLDGDVNIAQYNAAQFNNMSSTAPFRHPNKYYELSRRTSGMYQPLRPNMNIEDYESTLNALCSGKPLGAIVADSNNSVPGLDAAGRLIFDPFNRSPGGQMEDFMEALMSVNSIRIVGPYHELAPAFATPPPAATHPPGEEIPPDDGVAPPAPTATAAPTQPPAPTSTPLPTNTPTPTATSAGTATKTIVPTTNTPKTVTGF